MKKSLMDGILLIVFGLILVMPKSRSWLTSYMQILLRFIRRIPQPTVTKEQALTLARLELEKHGKTWTKILSVDDETTSYFIRLQGNGRHAIKVKVDMYTGNSEIIEFSILRK